MQLRISPLPPSLGKSLDSITKSLNSMAEGVGFEPTVACTTAVFKTAALNQTRPPLPIGGTALRSSQSGLENRPVPDVFNGFLKKN